MKNTPKKPSYKALQLENQKLVKEISQIAIKNVELEKKVALFNRNWVNALDENVSLSKDVTFLSDLNSTLSDNRTHFQCERAELATALLEIVNCKELEIAQEVARIALKQVNTVVKLKDTTPF